MLHSLTTYQAETGSVSECCASLWRHWPAVRKGKKQRVIYHCTAPVEANASTEICVILRTGVFFVITQRVEVISYPRFGTTCWSHLQGSRIRKRNYYYSLRNNIQKSVVLIHFAAEVWNHSWRMKNQLDVTCYFISLIMRSTCFGH